MQALSGRAIGADETLLAIVPFVTGRHVIAIDAAGLDALRTAASGREPEASHERATFRLASEALRRDREQGWGLLSNPGRLRIQTIDALCASLTRQMPVLSRFGGQPEVIEDASALFAEAARNLLASLDGQSAQEAAYVERK